MTITLEQYKALADQAVLIISNDNLIAGGNYQKSADGTIPLEVKIMLRCLSRAYRTAMQIATPEQREQIEAALLAESQYPVTP